MTTSGKLSLRQEDDVAVLALDDGKANTFERSTFEALDALLREAAAGPAGALVITGRAGFLSAGLDLKVLPGVSRAEQTETIRAFGHAMLTLFTLEKPVVASVTGHALGAGGMLALAADVRIAADGSFRVGLNEVAIGMVVPTFGVEIARAVVPPPMLAQWLLHGRVFTPAELLAQGVVEAVKAPDKVLPAAIERAKGLAGFAKSAYAGTKQRLRDTAVAHARAKLDDEARTLVEAIGAGA